MSTRPLLEGAPEDREIARLKRELAGLELELQTAKDEATKHKQAAADSVTAIRALRHQLEPFYNALKMVFGEIERVNVTGVDWSHSPDFTHPALSPKWEMLKKRLDSRKAEIIDVLQHGAMTSSQMSAALHWDLRTTNKHIQAMRAAGYLEKNGGKLSLKE